MAEGIPTRLSPADGRKFAFTVGAAFLVLGGVARWRGHVPTAAVFGTLGVALVVLGLLVPGRLGPVNRAWMGLAHLISKVTTPVFMGVVFFLVITPVGLVLRLFGKAPMTGRPGVSTNWVARDPASRRGDLARQF